MTTFAQIQKMLDFIINDILYEHYKEELKNKSSPGHYYFPTPEGFDDYKKLHHPILRELQRLE